MSDSLQSHRLYSPWDSPGQNPGVGSLSLLQGIFPTQESNPGLLHFAGRFFTSWATREAYDIKILMTFKRQFFVFMHFCSNVEVDCLNVISQSSLPIATGWIRQRSRGFLLDMKSDFPFLQWLRFHLTRQGVQVWSLVGELRCHMPCSQKNQNIKQK